MYKTVLAILVTVVAVPVYSQNMDLRVRFDFNNAPLNHILEQYSEWTGKKVEIVRNVTARISIRTEKSVTLSDAVSMVNEELRKQNIGLFPISSSRLIATWIDPDEAPMEVTEPIFTSTENDTPYTERRRKRLAEMRKRLQSGDETSNTNLNPISGSSIKLPEKD